MSTETYEDFKVAAPIPRAARKGAGRKAEPNPLRDAVRDIVGQWNVRAGAPMTYETRFALDGVHGETLKQRHDKIRRQLTKASQEFSVADKGDHLAYGVEMRILDTDDDGAPLPAGSYRLVFWDKNATPE